MTFFVSMVPVLELRGAIPLGVAGGLSPLAAMVVAVIGNMVPVPFIILFIRQIFHWLRDKGRIGSMVRKLENRASAKSAIVKKYAGIGLCILVAIPLPGTGAWTGALVAALFKLPFWRSLLAIVLGVIGCGVIMCLASYGVVGFLSFLL